MAETSGTFIDLFIIAIQGNGSKKKHSDPPEYFYIEFRVASHVFVSQVQWLMVIYSWVAESGYIEGAEFPWNNYVH